MLNFPLLEQKGRGIVKGNQPDQGIQPLMRNDPFTTPFHATTVIAVKKGSQVAVGGDGQVSHGNTVLKNNAHKVRKLKGGQLVGFAGSTADAFSLMERFEQKLEQNKGNLRRA